MPRIARLVLLVVLITLAGARPGQSQPTRALHEATERAGIAWEIGYDGETFANLRGGVTTGRASRGILDLSAEIDLGVLAGIPRTRIRANVIGAHGRSLSPLVGDDLLASSIDAVPTTRLQNLWAEHESPSGAWALRVGKQAVDDEFFSTDGSTLFLHMAAAYPFTLSPNAPPWPVASLAAQVRHRPGARWTLRAGVFGADGRYTDEETGNPHGLALGLAPSGALVIGEAVLRGRRGVYRAGAWHDTNAFEDARGAARGGLSALYAAADHVVVREGAAGAADANEEAEGLHVFGMASVSPERARAPYDYDLRGGAYWRGAVPGRDADVIGAGYFYPHVGRSARREATGPVTTESFWEVSYRAEVTDWIGLQASVQSIRNPGGARGARLPTATVAGLRLSVVL